MSDVPGGYFVGAPAQQPASAAPAASQEQNNQGNIQTPGDYFMGTPENLRHQQKQDPSTSGLKRTSGSGSRWCCFGGSEVQN